MEPLRSSFTGSFCFVLATALPSLAHAQLALSVASFGAHTSETIDLSTEPIGSVECDVPIPLSFTGRTETALDVWWASSADAGCESASARVDGTCTHLAIDPASVTELGSTLALEVTASTLFGDLVSPCAGTLMRRTFYFFDAATSPDLTTTFDGTTSVTIDVVLDTVAPSAPTLDGDAAGDTAIDLAWIDPADLPLPSSARFYVDANGCAHDAAPSSLLIVPGAAPPFGARVASVEATGATFDHTELDTATLGWTTARYGETGALGMTIVDEAGNESALSNLVCVYHARCMNDGGSTSGCGPTGLCSIAAPGSGRSAAWLALAFAAAVVVRARRRRARA